MSPLLYTFPCLVTTPGPSNHTYHTTFYLDSPTRLVRPESMSRSHKSYIGYLFMFKNSSPYCTNLFTGIVEMASNLILRCLSCVPYGTHQGYPVFCVTEF